MENVDDLDELLTSETDSTDDSSPISPPSPPRPPTRTSTHSAKPSTLHLHVDSDTSSSSSTSFSFSAPGSTSLNGLSKHQGPKEEKSDQRGVDPAQDQKEEKEEDDPSRRREGIIVDGSPDEMKDLANNPNPTLSPSAEAEADQAPLHYHTLRPSSRRKRRYVDSDDEEEEEGEGELTKQMNGEEDDKVTTPRPNTSLQDNMDIDVEASPTGTPPATTTSSSSDIPPAEHNDVMAGMGRRLRPREEHRRYIFDPMDMVDQQQDEGEEEEEGVKPRNSMRSSTTLTMDRSL